MKKEIKTNSSIQRVNVCYDKDLAVPIIHNLIQGEQ